MASNNNNNILHTIICPRLCVSSRPSRARHPRHQDTTCISVLFCNLGIPSDLSKGSGSSNYDLLHLNAFMQSGLFESTLGKLAADSTSIDLTDCILCSYSICVHETRPRVILYIAVARWAHSPSKALRKDFLQQNEKILSMLFEIYLVLTELDPSAFDNMTLGDES